MSLFYLRIIKCIIIVLKKFLKLFGYNYFDNNLNLNKYTLLEDRTAQRIKPFPN